MNIIDIEQGTEAWHAWRATRRMASESPALLGLSPWFPRTPFQLFEVKSGLRVIEQNEAMRQGLAHEPRAREIYERERGDLMVPHVVEGAGGYAASLDGISLDGSRILEVKCPRQGSGSGLWLDRVVPDHYTAQVQHQLMVTGAEVCDFAIYAPDLDRLAVIEIAPDPDMQARIRGAWDQFWPLYSGRTAPEPTDADHVTRSDEEWSAAASLFRDAQVQLKAVEAAAERARKRLLDLAGDGSAHGAGVTVTRYFARGNIDYGKVPALRGLDLDPYRKAGGFRFRVS